MRGHLARLLPAAALIVAAVAPGARIASGVEASPTAAAEGRPSSAWDTHGLAALSAPVLVGSRLVLYAKSLGPIGGVRLVGLDPATGRVKWSRQSSAASSSLGAPLLLAYDATRVFAYTPTGSAGRARVSAYSAETGKAIWTTADGYYFGDSLRLCSRAVCATASVSGGWAQVRINAATGAVEPAPAANTTKVAVGRQLAPQLYDSGTRSPELLVHAAPNGTVLWAKAVNRLFGAAVSSDNGWIWTLQRGVYVGSLGHRGAPPGPGETTTSDATLSTTVGIRAADGKVLWRKAGSPWCNGTLYAPESTLGVLCTYTGSHSPTNQAAPVVIDSVTVIGFDWATGATTFSRALDATAGDLFAPDGQPVWLGAHQVLVHSVPAVVLNLATGALTAPNGRTAGWCNAPTVSFEESGDQHEGAALLFPCSADGARIARQASQPTQAGIRVGNRFVWADQAGVHAVPAHA